MNIILFLGSGVSLDSGQPAVNVLTDRILNSDTHPVETQFLKALKEYDTNARKIGGSTYRSNDEIVGEIYRDATSYEDLYYLCDEIAIFDWGQHNSAIVPAFMESLVRKFSPFLKQISKANKLLEIGKYAHAAKKYIDKAVIENLTTPETIKGLDLIVKLAGDPRVSSLNILTLNHDLLVEDLLTQKGIPFEDGFGKADGNIRWFEPDTLLSDTKVKLVKLHGSIDWYSFLVDGYDKVGKVAINNTEQKYTADKDIDLTKKTPEVLSGLNKIKYYNYGIYTDIHYHFQRILYQNDVMLMSGYGWGDDAINTRLLTWLDKKRAHKLILLHNDPNILMDRCMIFDRDYSNWVSNGKLIPMGKWLSQASLQEVLEACTPIM
jgi:hypothetical protein